MRERERESSPFFGTLDERQALRRPTTNPTPLTALFFFHFYGMSSPRCLLVFGASGKTGSRVLARALDRGWRCFALVRSPERLPAGLRARLSAVFVGDLNDAASVARAIRAARPDALVDASSALPFGHDKGAPPNNADRGVLLDAVVATLAEDGRLADTNFVIVGGQLVPEPGGTINTLFARILEFLLRYVVAPGPWAAVDRAIARLWASPPALRFTMLRMGQMEVAPSRGELRFEPTTGGNYPRCAVSYDDVADAIVAFVAQDAAKPGPWGRKAVYLNYVRASSP